MDSLSVRELVKFYLPHLVTAGDYALAIQKDIKVHDAKGEGFSNLGQFLTDADLAVEGYLEVATLSKWAAVDFEGEEADKSLNRKYFAKKKDARFKVWVDPINGTFLYKDGRDGFDIILTIVDVATNKVVGAVDYLPARGVFYVGIEGLGGYCFDRNDLDVIDGGGNFRINHLQYNDLPIMTYHLKDPFPSKLKEIRRCHDTDSDYCPAAGQDFCICSILEREIVAYVKPKAKLIDWGAIAFIVEQAGGIVTDFNGQPIPNFLEFPKHRIPSLIVSTSMDCHAKIVKALKDYPL